MVGALLNETVAGPLKECKSNQRGSARFGRNRRRAGP